MTSNERRTARYARRQAKRQKKTSALAAKYDDINQVADANHLILAAKQSRKGVRFKASVQKYFVNLLLNVFKARRKILNGDDVRQGFIEFDIAERGKARHIRAMRFPERVIQRCLCDFVLVPYLLRSCVYDNGASQKDKGIHFAIHRCEHHIREFRRRYGDGGYVLLIDFSGYFDNIEHRHIYEIVEAKFKDEKLKLLIVRFIEAFGEKSIGIGSQVSQVFAVLYASTVDHYIREVLHIGLSARYMDDSYIMHPSKEYLESVVLPELIKRYSALGIKVNLKKTKIVSINDFKFLKVRFITTQSGKILLRPDMKAFARERRKLRKFKRFVDSGEMSMSDVRTAYQSFYGYYQHFDCKRELREMDRLYHGLFGEWPNHKKKKHKKQFVITRAMKKLFKKARKHHENLDSRQLHHHRH